MFADQLTRAVTAAPRTRLDALAKQVWAAHASGLVDDTTAQGLAEAIRARQTAVAAPRVSSSRRSAGSRPRAPQAVERRRQLSQAGWLPPQFGRVLTRGEIAALSIVATEVARQGECTLPVGIIAVRAGVSRSVVQRALRVATREGLISVDYRRRTYSRNDPNRVTIVSPDWIAWLRRRGRGVGVKKDAQAKSESYPMRPARWQKGIRWEYGADITSADEGPRHVHTQIVISKEDRVNRST